MHPENWMGDLKDDIWNKKLSEIVIPGTHDSGTYCINKKSKRSNLLPNLCCLNCIVAAVGAPWSKSQPCSIAEQLERGVRYIDLRAYLNKTDNEIYLVHGFEAGELIKELEGVAEFMKSHKGEVVILDMNHIYNCDTDRMIVMLEKIEDIFSNEDGDNSETNLFCQPPGNSDVTTYGQTIDADQRVIVAITDRPSQYNSTFDYKALAKRFGWIWSSEVNVNSPWANADKANRLKVKLKETMAERRPPYSLHVAQTILTPDTRDVFCGLCRRPRNLKQLAKKLNKHLPTWFEEFHKDYNLNIAIIDWPTQDLIDQMINFNKTN